MVRPVTYLAHHYMKLVFQRRNVEAGKRTLTMEDYAALEVLLAAAGAYLELRPLISPLDLSMYSSDFE